MFTGLIEETGTIKSIVQNSKGLDISVNANAVLSDLKLGDSISINGCCQTVTDIKENNFSVQAVFETVNLTNFKYLKTGDKVNLERALTLQSRLGGHIVSGHVECISKCTNITEQGNAKIFEFELPSEILKYIVYKGSIAINGISLTVANLIGNKCQISVIPHTILHTNLCFLKTGDYVNIETDVIAKYIENLLCKQDNTGSKITLEFLKENGF